MNYFFIKLFPKHFFAFAKLQNLYQYKHMSEQKLLKKIKILSTLFVEKKH